MSNYSKIYDSVHGFIRFNELESHLIDSLPFQRLHYLHQLGIAYLVYPGATHTRFEHSLGVMELGTRIFERIWEKFDGEKPDREYWCQIVRLAALCHDLGHLPFSHVAEKLILGNSGHEKWTMNILSSAALQPVWHLIEQKYLKKNVLQDVIKLAIGEKKLKKMGFDFHFSAWERVLCQVVTDDFFGADRIDYLLRDAKCTGVSYGLFDFHQLIEMLVILPCPQGGWQLGIEENGIESCEALLLARHFMHKRVYQYPSVKAFSFHLSRFMKTEWQHPDIEKYLSWTDNDVLCAIQRAQVDPDHPGHLDALSIVIRAKRFKAIACAKNVSIDQAEQVRKELHIPVAAFTTEFPHSSHEDSSSTFPVLKANGSVVDSSSCSEITIPSGSASWVYIAPEYEKPFRHALENLTAIYLPA
jgi:HD superfamily phosphohydrolase